jgi:hypothetical protein
MISMAGRAGNNFGGKLVHEHLRLSRIVFASSQAKIRVALNWRPLMMFDMFPFIPAHWGIPLARESSGAPEAGAAGIQLKMRTSLPSPISPLSFIAAISS